MERVSFVADLGSGSMATCSRHLARELHVPVIYTQTYERAALLEGISLFDPRSAIGLVKDLAFIQVLRRSEGLIHLSNHHLARFGRFLSSPYVVTVHDLIRLRDMDPASGVVLIRRPKLRDRILFRLDHEAIRRAAALIATSQATRRDLIRLLGIPAKQITVVYNGIDHERFRPTKRRLADAPYILFVGVEHPRKNLISVLRAFRRLKDDWRFRDLRLIKLGGPGYRGKPFRRHTLAAIAELGLENDVQLIGRVEDEAMAAYYAGAECLIMPSLSEGFGLPAVEAMACGCPVIVSNHDPLPEIAGDSAMVTAPDVVSIVRTLRSLLGDRAVREDLRARGLQRARRFSWATAAAQTRAVYRGVLATNG